MRIRSGCLACVAILGFLAWLLACGSSGKSGFLYLVSQGTNPGMLSTYSFPLTNGILNTSNSTLTPVGTPANTGTSPSGAQPTALTFDSSQTFAYVANFQSSDIAAFSLNKDGSLALSGNTALTIGTNPVALVLDPGDKFLFVADQGIAADPNCLAGGNPAACTSRVSVFSVSGTTLTEVAGSPFKLSATFPNQASPSALAVVITPVAEYLYVAQQGDGTLASFKVDTSSGALTSLGTPITVGTAPSALLSPLTTGATFLYVANSGSSNIYGFKVNDDGSFVPAAGSPIGTGTGPVAMLSDPKARYLFALDNVSSQISGYRINAVTGALTPLSPSTTSTGANPVAFTLRSDGTVNGNFWLFVSDFTGNTVSSYELISNTGVLSPLPQLLSPEAPYGIGSR